MMDPIKWMAGDCYGVFALPFLIPTGRTKLYTIITARNPAETQCTGPSPCEAQHTASAAAGASMTALTTHPHKIAPAMIVAT